MFVRVKRGDAEVRPVQQPIHFLLGIQPIRSFQARNANSFLHCLCCIYGPVVSNERNHSSLKFLLHYPVLMDAPHLDALSSIRATHLCHNRVCRTRVRILLWVSALAIILYCSILQEQEQSRNPVGQPETVHILMFFAKAEKNDLLQQQLRANIRSMVKHATGRIKYHFLGDANSTRIAADILENVFDTIPHREDLVIQVQTYEVESVVAKVGHDIWPIQQLFKSYQKNYDLFNDIFYFIPFALHKVIDLSEVDRIIKVDADMRLMTDIRKLWREFDEFKNETIFALAQEQQPVYYQRFAIARGALGDDRLGMPPPGGKPGYNGGLYLINLDHMSKSKKYQAAVSERNLRYLMRKYYFTKSHLGDQEVVTILGMEYPELFHTLPCTWNRQLCRVYARIITIPSALFELFNRCDGAVNLYHGNCHTPFPPEAEL